MARVDYTTDSETDSRLNPAEQAKFDQISAGYDSGSELSDREKDAINDLESQFDNKDSDLNPSQNDSASAAVNNQESSVPDNGFYQPSNDKKRNNLKSTLKLAKKSRGIIAIVGILLSLAATFSALLPLKLNSLLDNIDQQIGSVAHYSVEERLQYITTRWLAMRVMKEAYPGDEHLVFCKGGGIICSLTSTKYSAWFEKMLDAKFEKEGVNVRVVINSHGRSGLGGKASHFTIKSVNKDLDSVMKGIEKEVGHKEIRKRIKNDIKRVHGRNYLMRFISKRILYNKYGVKSFNIIPEKHVRAWKDFKAKIKSEFASRAIAKISPKLAAVLSCINGRDALGCAETLDKLKTKLDGDVEKKENALKEKPNDPKAKLDYEAAKSNKNTFSKFTDNLANGDGLIAKIINKELMKKFTTASAIVGMIDMAAGFIGALDSGTLEVIGRAQVAQTYASFAYDEGISPVVVNDMMKTGDLQDIRYLELATSLFDGAESSPLYSEIQAGGITSSILPILSGNSVSASGGIRTKCTVDGKEKVVTLDPGELVCPEKKVVQDYTAFTKNPAWQTLAAVANFWNNSIGAVIDVAQDIASQITEPIVNFVTQLPGIKQVMDFSQDIMGTLVQWAISYIFNIPNVGIDAPGNNNYEGLVGAQMVSTADSLENGKTESGSGIGGKLLSDNELAMIATKTEQEDKENFEQQPILAKIFDPNLRNSVANQMLAIMPIGKKSAINFLAKTPALLLSPLMPNNRASAATNRLAVMKSMGIPWYGYTDPEVLNADPNKYTAETCKTYDETRKKSLERDRSTGYVVPVYKTSDPCALEEVVAGILAERAGDTDSKYYIKDPSGSSNSSKSSSSTGEAVGEPELEEAQQTGWGGHSNGEISESDLQTLSFSPESKMNKQAASAMEEMNKAYKADNGSNLTINEAYRDCATQIRYSKELGSRAAPAPPCISNHGWGLAADINVGGFDSPVYKWLEANAHKYGYVNPPWAKPGGSKPEPWHWEYARKV